MHCLFLGLVLKSPGIDNIVLYLLQPASQWKKKIPNIVSYSQIHHIIIFVIFIIFFERLGGLSDTTCHIYFFF